MKLSDFDYNLPKELIAQYPLKDRDSARLMVVNRQRGTIEHRIFKDVAEFMRKNDILVLNDTKVIPARLFGKRSTGGKVEVFLLNRKQDAARIPDNSLMITFNALIRPNRVKLKEIIIFNEGISAQISARNEVTFYVKSLEDLYSHGVLPLPPYIKRDADKDDNIYYQTVYARQDGSVAAPTAGLHFSKELLVNLGSCGINIAYVTLHVGYGTFKPVKSDDIKEHTMEPEYFSIPDETISLINERSFSNGRLFAVGTTSLRTLETYAGGVKEGFTNLFVYPGYEFKLVDCLLTNFHLPRTTLFMLVCAFCAQGKGNAELAKKAYQSAIDNKYRFYSYGDAMLII